MGKYPLLPEKGLLSVHSFEGLVGMRLRNYIVCVLIYCNLPGWLHPTHSAIFPLGA